MNKKTTKSNSLARNKMLKSKKEIDELFTKSLSISNYPVRVVYIIKNNNENKVAFSVSKKRFKRAVDRNKIKRLLKEAYRLQQNELNIKGINMMWIYTGKELPGFENLYISIHNIIKKLNKKDGHS